MLKLLKGNFEEDENGIGLSLGLSIGGNYNNEKMDYNSDDKMLVQERQRSQKRKIQSERMENEELLSKETVRRKEEIGSFGNECCTCDEAAKSLNLSLNQDSYGNDQNLAVPIWARDAGKRELMKKNSRGFRLYNENVMSYNQCGSSVSEENLSGKSSFKNYKALSNGSTERCSSSPISECQSSSPKGRSSSENAQGNQPSTTSSNNAMPIKSDCGIQLLSGMPCVSATGNGPNGKTINGLLCKYNNKTEISIVCVCHGESFNPSEFVEHAGGVDVSHPLRHITVILDGWIPK